MKYFSSLVSIVFIFLFSAAYIDTHNIAFRWAMGTTDVLKIENTTTGWNKYLFYIVPKPLKLDFFKRNFFNYQYKYEKSKKYDKNLQQVAYRIKKNVKDIVQQNNKNHWTKPRTSNSEYRLPKSNNQQP